MEHPILFQISTIILKLGSLLLLRSLRTTILNDSQAILYLTIIFVSNCEYLINLWMSEPENSISLNFIQHSEFLMHVFETFFFFKEHSFRSQRGVFLHNFHCLSFIHCLFIQSWSLLRLSHKKWEPLAVLLCSSKGKESIFKYRHIVFVF